MTFASNRRRQLFWFSLCAAPLTALLAHPASSAADPLKERAMVAPETPIAHAMAVNEEWIQLYLPETEYSADSVAQASKYVIKSSNDPAFSKGVAPAFVHHRHWPESAPYADSNAFGDVARLHTVYRVFLKLPKPLKAGKKYKVTIDADVKIAGPYAFPFDSSKPNEAIHVNQVAYRAVGPKVAYLSMWTGQGSVDFGGATAFHVVNEATGSTVFSGLIKLDITGDKEPWSRSNVYSMDFSSFTTSGKYHLYVPKVGKSFSFKVSSEAYKEIGYTALRGLTMQRDGNHGLDSPALTHWFRPPAHLDDAIVESNGQRVNLVGGHMDAGDRGKYPHNMADVSGSLLTAMRLFPAEVEALGESLQIPESQNGVPDLIDEAVYELDFLYKAVMNTPKDGTLPSYLRPQNANGSGGYELGIGLLGQKNRKLYDETMGPSAAETLYAAGVLAMAYNTPLMKKHVPAKCNDYLIAAKRAFKGWKDHASSASYFKEQGWFDVWRTGPTPYADEMMVAATNLLEATADSAYIPPLKDALPPDLSKTKRYGWALSGPWLTAYVSLLYATAPALEQEIPGIKRKAMAAILHWGDSTLVHDTKPYPRPFGAPLVTAVYKRVGWYSSGAQVAYPAMVAYGVTKDVKYRDIIIKTWNYLLGTNPLSRTFLSGLGDPQRSPRWLVHEIAHYQWQKYKAGGGGGWSEMPPGIPVGDIQDGMFDSYLDDPWNVQRKTKKFPPPEEYPALYRYHDSWTVKNELTIDRMTRGAVSVIPLISLSP